MSSRSGIAIVTILSLLPWIVQGADSASATREQRVAALFDTLVDQPPRLRVFLQEMPKGGELHNHLVGSVYAEDYLRWSDEDGYCIERSAMSIRQPPCDAPGLIPARGLQQREPRLYQQMIDALSLRNFVPAAGTGELSGHDRTFATFGRFYAIASHRLADTLIAVRKLAAANYVSYVETMARPAEVDAFVAAASQPLGRPVDFEASLGRIQAELFESITRARRALDEAEARARESLCCDTPKELPACKVRMRYLYYIDRTALPASVFAQMAFGHALVKADPRFVGLNLVAPEDDPVSLRDFHQHMAMFRFFATRYPGVLLSLHAGELTLGLVPPQELRFHIRESIEVAGARRIGHGYSIAYEEDAPGLLARMARDRIAIEINLTSNAITPGIMGAEHPMRLYHEAGVPIVLSTDDEGVFRIDLTHEYQRAAVEHAMRYRELKNIARNGIEYSFVPGESLWLHGNTERPVAVCGSALRAAVRDAGCAEYLAHSEKARLQWELEQDFAAFEERVLTWRF